MKKLIMIASVLAAVLFVVPVKVEAADQSGSYAAGRYGTVEWEWEYTDEEQGIKEWSFYLTASRDLQYLYFQFVPVNVTINSVSEGREFGRVLSGNYIFLESTSGISSGERVLLFTVITADDEGADEECELSISPQNLNCSSNISGYYFDNNGNSITQEEYVEVCGNTTPTDPDDPNDIPNSQTGSVVPYVAIGGGILAIVVVYLFSRKSNKVYKI